MYRTITVAFITFMAVALVSITAFGQDSEGEYRHEPSKAGEAVFFNVDAEDGEGPGEVDIEATLIDRTLYVTGKVEELSSPVVETNSSKDGVHLVVRASGDSPEKVFPLELQVTNDETRGAIGGSLDLNEEQIEQLRDGKFRVSVHTEDYPNGEVSGKLKPD